MALRIFLVGLVASLALDLPSRGRVRTQWEDGQTWVTARVAAPAAPEASNEPDPAAVPSPSLAVAMIEPATPISRELVASDSVAAPSSTSTPALVALADLPPAAPVVEPMPMPMPAPAPEIADILPTPAEAPVEIVVPAPAIAATEVPAPPEPEVAPALTTSMPEVAVSEALRTPEAAPDDAFRAVVGSMASAFAADASAMPVPEASPSPIAEPLPLLADDIAPPHADEPAPLPIADEADVFSGPTGLAYALNREAEGLGPIEAPAVPEVARNETVPDGGAEWPDASSRADRLEQAVKLTGQAVQAWASLLIQRPAVVSIQR